MNKLIFLITVFLISNMGVKPVFSDNPIVANVGMADPHIFIFEKKAYLYSTRDADSTAKNFVMPDWNIWSSDDLINWKLERTIYPSETYMGPSNNCWAPDVAYKNGSYYFYFSNGNKNTGVMKSLSPAGPFTDVLKRPMLNEDLTPTKEYDPGLLVDDDQTVYMVFGHYRKADKDLNFYIARLNDDMVSLAEDPKIIEIQGDINVLGGNDKPNLHKRDGLYYLSAGSHYATSSSPYGPYTRRGNTGNNTYGLDSRAHGNFFTWNNQWFHTWCHFHLGKDVGRYRESYISYLHYKDNGEMVTDDGFLDNHFSTGVGQYDATWDKIEAEWYMSASGISKKESPNGGFEIQDIKNGGHLFFPNIKNLDRATHISFYLSSAKGGTIDVYANETKEKLLGSVEIKDTGNRNSYKKFDCKISNTGGASSLYITFNGEQNDLFYLDWFNFTTN